MKFILIYAFLNFIIIWIYEKFYRIFFINIIIIPHWDLVG